MALHLPKNLEWLRAQIQSTMEPAWVIPVHPKLMAFPGPQEKKKAQWLKGMMEPLCEMLRPRDPKNTAVLRA
jgi:hypothetical protein